MLSPRLPAEAMKTFQIAEPLPTHWVPITCEQVDGGCNAHAFGWRTICDLTTSLGLRQAKYIRDKAGRHFTFEKTADGKIVVFTFPAGQRCFTAHRRSLGRPALFVVRNGDHRGSGHRPCERRIFDRPDQWVETLQENTERLITAAQRG